jgi:thymidylate synthase ThyX
MITPALPMKAVLISAPKFPLGTLYYVWKQSRHNKPLPSAEEIEDLMRAGLYLSGKRDPSDFFSPSELAILMGCAEQLGYTDDPEGMVDAARHIRDELDMIINESIPVVENLHFVFHLQNIPISLREQLVRHRIGTTIDPRVGADIIPNPISLMMREMPPGSFMHMDILGDLAESTFWSQTSRVIPADKFFDEGRYIVPKSLEGKTVTSQDPTDPWDQDAKAFYLDTLKSIQTAYQMLMAAGVHIEDCRQIVPVGTTHGITWTVNLKALLHIFGKRSSWIAQIGIWGEIMGMMADELCNKVHPMFRRVLLPQCIKKGKYVGCPVAGTNAERVSGVDGMPPCPIWISEEKDAPMEAVLKTYRGGFPGRTKPAWQPPSMKDSDIHIDFDRLTDIREWTSESPVEMEMLHTTAKIYSGLWGFPVLEGIPEGIEG